MWRAPGICCARHDFDVGQFVYSGTMLVHQPASPGESIHEGSPIAPKWAYPARRRKRRTSSAQEHGAMPIVLLHPAGVYDNQRCVPTLAQQIARIYERDLKSYLYAGDPEAGQSMLHKHDMIDAFRRTVDRRNELPSETCRFSSASRKPWATTTLQDQIGRLMHGEDEWTTLRVPKAIAKRGRLLEEKLKPVVPDAIDQGEKPFIRSFMVEMADDHYALDITRARRSARLGAATSHPHRAAGHHRGAEARPAGLVPPQRHHAAGVAQEAGDEGQDAGRCRRSRDATPHAACGTSGRILQHRARHLADHVPATLSLQSPALIGATSSAGHRLIAFATLSLSWQHAWAHWACAALGHVGDVRAARCSGRRRRPATQRHAGRRADRRLRGADPARARGLAAGSTDRPRNPPGWSLIPSGWTQRLPIIVLAFVGLLVSRVAGRLSARPYRWCVGPVLRRRPGPEERHRGDHYLQRVPGLASARCGTGGLYLRAGDPLYVILAMGRDTLVAQDGCGLWKHDTELAQQPADAIDARGGRGRQVVLG